MDKNVHTASNGIKAEPVMDGVDATVNIYTVYSFTVPSAPSVTGSVLSDIQIILETMRLLQFFTTFPTLFTGGHQERRQKIPIECKKIEHTVFAKTQSVLGIKKKKTIPCIKLVLKVTYSQHNLML